jgi:hypothetical protein
MQQAICAEDRSQVAYCLELHYIPDLQAGLLRSYLDILCKARLYALIVQGSSSFLEGSGLRPSWRFKQGSMALQLRLAFAIVGALFEMAVPDGPEPSPL